MPPGGYMVSFIETVVAGTSGGYHDFLQHVVLQQAHLFAQLSRFGEVLIGCALVLGLWTRVAAAFGVALALNYLPANAVWTRRNRRGHSHLCGCRCDRDLGDQSRAADPASPTGSTA